VLVTPKVWCLKTIKIKTNLLPENGGEKPFLHTVGISRSKTFALLPMYNCILFNLNSKLKTVLLCRLGSYQQRWVSVYGTGRLDLTIGSKIRPCFCKYRSIDTRPPLLREGVSLPRLLRNRYRSIRCQWHQRHRKRCVPTFKWWYVPPLQIVLDLLIWVVIVN